MRSWLRTAAGYLLLLCAIPLIVAGLRIFVVDTARVHTRSMVGTLLPGDVVLVNKLPYGPRLTGEIPFTSIPLPPLRFPQIARYRVGDLVLVHRAGPRGMPRRLLKRIAGAPGDSLVVRRGTVLLNGRSLPLPPAGSAGGEEELPGFRIPRPGDTLVLTPAALALFGNAIAAESSSSADVPPFTDDRNSMDARRSPDPLTAADHRTTADPRTAGDPHTVPAESLAAAPGRHRVREEWYYLLGDNRGNSTDSRSWGCVARSELVGRPVLIFWSRDEEDTGWWGGTRWGRIGTIVR